MNTKALLTFLVAVPSCAWAQTWDCRTLFGFGDVAVTVTKDANADTGEVSLPGTDVRQSARYQVRGLERLWTFGYADGQSPAFAFGIQPSDKGIYYIRGNGNAPRWIPQDTYYCEDRLVQEQRERQTAERELEQPIVLEAEQPAARDAELLDQYILMIQSKINQHWDRPLSARPGIDCVVTVVQLPTGDVVSAKVASCNGDEAVRRSIEQAVMDASPLPKPPHPSLFERNLVVNFRPDE